jgi:hypothetical protein
MRVEARGPQATRAIRSGSGRRNVWSELQRKGIFDRSQKRDGLRRVGRDRQEGRTDDCDDASAGDAAAVGGH